MKVTASSLIRWSGLAALVAGLIFAGIQPIHPPDVVASVTTGAWGHHHPLEDGHVPPFPHRHYRDLRQAS